MINLKPKKIGEIFDIDTGRDVIISRTKEGNVPLISHQHSNNGITRFIEKLDNRKLYNHKATIALADRGVFYATTQTKDFHIGTRVKALTFKDGEKSEKIRLYFVTAINKLQILFSEYLNNATDKLPELKIILPLKENDTIDYDYIEKYMSDITSGIVKKIRNKSNENISKLAKVSCIQNIDFTDEDIKIINDFKNANRKKYCFKDLFVVKGNPQLNKDSFIFTNDLTKYPYFTRTVLNNGIAGYVEYLDDDHLNEGNSIAVGMLGMQFFYMKNDYYAGQFTKSIIPRFDKFNEKIAHFFITYMNKSNKLYKRLLVRDFEKEFNKTEILLPIDNDGQVDYNLIEQYMGVINKRVFQKIKKRNENKISKIIGCIE